MRWVYLVLLLAIVAMIVVFVIQNNERPTLRNDALQLAPLGVQTSESLEQTSYFELTLAFTET